MLEGLIRHYTKGNKAQFAKLLGVSAQTISAWIARNTFDAELIYAKCRYVDSSWLLTGEGAMLQETENNNAPTPKHTVEIAHQVPHGSSEGIPLIPLDAVAGFPAESGGGVFRSVWRTASAMSYRSSRTKGQTSLSGCLATPWCRYIIVATSSLVAKSQTSASSSGVLSMYLRQARESSLNVCRKV